MDTNQISQEEKAARAERERQKSLAILKASNEMLDDFMQGVIERSNRADIGEDKKNVIFEQVQKAKEENLDKAKAQLGASVEDIKNATYAEPTEEYKRKYAERLQRKGITDAQMRAKKDDSATVTTSGSPNGVERRARITSQEELEEKTLSQEQQDELMRSTMATDEKLEEWRRKTEEFEKNRREMFAKQEAEKKEKEKNKLISKTSLPKETKQNTSTSTVEKVSRAEHKEEKPTEAPKRKKSDNKVVKYDFDFSQIPDYVQYDVVPLPSHGECYPKSSPLRCGRLPIAYLTAADENIIASPNMYRDGKIIDVILTRKILDKSVDPTSLCSGDRDAIALWLRATGYGPQFPIVVSNPNNGDARYNTTVDLSTIDFLPFDLKGDENGHFEYVLEKQNGKKDKLTFKVLTAYEQEVLRKVSLGGMEESEREKIKKNVDSIKEILDNITDIDVSMRENLEEDIAEIGTWADSGIKEENGGEEFSKFVTENMIFCTVAVNGNTDEEFIRNYIENMRSFDSYNYRNYLSSHVPGMDFNITINIPESDGGGTIRSFLRIDDALFLNTL